MTLVSLVAVVSVARLTPRMTRVTFTGDGLTELETWPDQQLKLLFPPPGGELRLPSEPAAGDGMRWYTAYLALPDRPIMRGFTVRALSGDRLVVDFVLHDHGGPAATWARTARPGDRLARYGPAAVYARALNFEADWLLLAGDETALPAVGSLLETTVPSRATVLVEIADAAEEQDLPGVRWVHRHDAPPGEKLIDAVRALAVPTGSTFAWLAGEASLVRTLRRDLVARGVPKKAIDFAGYWRKTLTQDDAPTEADLTEARERLSEMGTML